MDVTLRVYSIYILAIISLMKRELITSFDQYCCCPVVVCVLCPLPEVMD